MGSRPASLPQQVLAVFGPHGRGQVDVRHLAAGVHARVGAARDGQLGGLLPAQHHAQRVLDLALDGPLPLALAAQPE